MQQLGGGLLTAAVRADPEYRQLLELLASEAKRTAGGGSRKILPVSVDGLCESASDLLCAALCEDSGDTRVLILCPEESDCRRITDLLRAAGIDAGFWPARELRLRNMSASRDYEHLRLAFLLSLMRGGFSAVVTTPDAAVSVTMPRELLSELSVRIAADARITPDGLIGHLTAAGYRRSELAEGPGQFAVRGGGGIVDICCADAGSGSMRDVEADSSDGLPVAAYRIEFFGDEIDRLCVYDPGTQRVTGKTSEFTLPPAAEVIPGRDALEAVRKETEKLIAKAGQDGDRARAILSEELSDISAAEAAGGGINFADRYISLIYPDRPCLLDYLEDGGFTLCVEVRSAAVGERLEGSEKLLSEEAVSLAESGLLPGRYASFTAGSDRLTRFLSGTRTVLCDTLARGLSGRRLAGMFSFRTRRGAGFSGNTGMLAEETETLTAGQYSVIIMTSGEEEAGRVASLLRERGESPAVSSDPFGRDIDQSSLAPGAPVILTSVPTEPFEMQTPRVALLSAGTAREPGERSGAGGRRRTSSSGVNRTGRNGRKSAAGRILSFNDLRPGDYVVHETHGIGIYEGITTLDSGGMVRDYITVRYAGSDRLFLPAEQLERLSKYIGSHADDGTLTLSKFGGGEWTRAKSRAKASLKKIAADLIKLYAERSRLPGHAFPPDDAFQREFEEAFEFEETEAQLEASGDIKRDMMKSAPMDRLLCGDVGYGKTEVAFRAIYKAVLDGKQAAMLVPTTILALQHYRTAVSRMRSFPVNIEMISRFRSRGEQQKIIERTARGDVDLLIGTHRLLSKDITFRDLGLLVVDEEQRFGVAQKEKIKQRSSGIDVLSLSATPIPRTLNMAMTGIRDISVLDEAPTDRLPVQTYVLEHDDLILAEAIRRELRRGGQVFYLHNYIETVYGVADSLKKAFPEARIAVAHGRMEKDDIEDIWRAMTEGAVDILVCTTIIESGIDLPNANTLIVTGAHRMGLSQLHQLRGRVGRSPRRAYAYFTFPKDKALSEIAEKRLEAIREYAEFGAGFRIAMRDMELRGVGNILGAEQSGHMDAVGYDLYVKLLNRAILEEKGESSGEPGTETECSVTLRTDAHLPASYIPSASQRMALYKRISHVASKEDCDDIFDEMTDRYGSPPDPAAELLDVALLRSRAERLGVSSITQNGTEVRISQKNFDTEAWGQLSQMLRGKIRAIPGDSPAVILRVPRESEAPAYVFELFNKYARLKGI